MLLNTYNYDVPVEGAGTKASSRRVSSQTDNTQIRS